jgi:hypothetical protein
VFRTEDVWLRCIHWQRAPKVTARRWIRNCVRPKKVKRYIKQIVKRYIKQRLANISTGRLPPERKPVSWRFFLVVVRDFYYNATPKASPKRECGEAIRVCVECLFLRSPSRAPYRTPPACANRATYPNPPPIVPVPESSIAAQAAVT